jgi:hypothetical protein
MLFKIKKERKLQPHLGLLNLVVLMLKIVAMSKLSHKSRKLAMVSKVRY